MAKKKPEKLPVVVPSLDTQEGRDEILRRAAKGEKAMANLAKVVFQRDRDKGGLHLSAYGDSFIHALYAFATNAAMGDLAIREALMVKIQALRDEVAGPTPTPLEKILAERIALTWFSAHEADRIFSHHSEVSLKTAVSRESIRDKANKRFLSACKALATVRRLGNPTVQFNQVVENQQVNVANP